MKLKDFIVITESQIKRRNYWVSEIEKLSGSFNNDFERLSDELRVEVKNFKTDSLLSHLRLCGAIPERYKHDSSEEKLYSKYTDALLSEAFNFLGLNSIVLTERADAADVECAASDFSFVADAKAFRLSRTAKNQKDFKVQAMDGWKRGKPFAMVVCPIYQLPTKSSQIYEQAISRDVCIFSYSHLALLVQLAASEGTNVAEKCLHTTFKTISLLNPSKDSSSYWRAVNAAVLNSHPGTKKLWKSEKIASIESICAAKEEALSELATERERILRMSKLEAVKELIKKSNIDNREKVVRGVSDSGILDLL